MQRPNTDMYDVAVELRYLRDKRADEACDMAGGSGGPPDIHRLIEADKLLAESQAYMRAYELVRSAICG